MKVIIYQPSKSTMQSGRARQKQWFLEYELSGARQPDPLMGWNSAPDTLNQVRMKFSSQEEAVQFAQSKGWSYELEEASQRKIVPKSFADNFKIVSRT